MCVSKLFEDVFMLHFILNAPLINARHLRATKDKDQVEIMIANVYWDTVLQEDTLSNLRR